MSIRDMGPLGSQAPSIRDMGPASKEMIAASRPTLEVSQRAVSAQNASLRDAKPTTVDSNRKMRSADDITFWQRVGAVGKGTAKSYGSGFTAAAGTTADLVSEAQRKTGDVTQQEERARYQRSVDDWSAKLASAKTDEERAKFQERLDKAQKQLASFETNYNRGGLEEQAAAAAKKLNETADNLSQSAAVDIERAKTDLGFGGQALIDLAVAGGQLAGDIGLGVLTGGGALIPMAVRSFGGGTQQARQEGASLGQQVAYGAGSAALSVGLEKLSNFAKPLSKAFGAGFADEVITKLGGKLAATAAGRTVLAALGEGFEEGLETLLDPLLKRATYDKDAKITADTLAEAGYNALIGGALGGLLGAGGEIASARSGDNAPSVLSGVESAANTAEAPTETPAAERAAEAIVEGERAVAADAMADALVESVAPSAKQVNAIAKDPAALERLGIEPNGKTASQIRAEVREALAPKAAETKVSDPLARALIGNAGESSTSAIVENSNFFDNESGKFYTEDAKSGTDVGRKYGVVVGADGRGVNASKRRSDQAQSVIDRAAKGESISLEELESIPEIAFALSETENGVETVNLPNRDKIIADGVSRALERGSYSGKTDSGKDEFSGVVRKDRRIDIVIGVAGSGKSSVYSNRISKEHGSRIIDTDDYRDFIPEYNGRNAGLVHEEASQIKDEVLFRALEDGENILLSTVGNDAEKLARNILKYRDLGYSVHLHLNHLSNEKAVGRVVSRYVSKDGEIGRLVAPELVKAMGDKPMRAYLEIIGIGGIENGEIGSSNQSNAENYGNRGEGGGANRSDARQTYREAKEALASWDAYDNDVPFGEPARYLPEISRKEVTDEGNTVGAAEHGFDPFTAAQNEYGTLPSGENPVRPDDVPVSTDGTDRVSQSVVTVKGARVTPEEFVPLLENETMKGRFSFIPITNDATVQSVMDAIMREGWETSLANWTADVRKGRTSDRIEAMGAMLYNHAVNAGDFQLAMDIFTDYQYSGRNTARALQARRILKKLTPESRLYMMRRSIQRMVDDLGLDEPITLPQELVDAYTNAEDEAAADKVVDEIQQYVADQIPPTFVDKWTAWRYTSMLGNFKTQHRNFAGNIGMAVVTEMKNAIATSLETLARGKAGRAHAIFPGKALMDAARADFRTHQDEVMAGQRYADSMSEDAFARGVQEKRRIFKSPLLEGYRKATNRAMNNEVLGDAAFSRRAYARALAGYLKANNVTAEQFSDAEWQAKNGKFLDKARSFAAHEAQEATFRDHNVLSDWVSRIGRRADTPRAVRAVAEGLLPFRRTPANILVRAAEYSPLGIVKNAVDVARKARGADISGVDIINGIAKTMTGTGIFALGMMLRNAGLLRGGDDEDEEQAAFDELTGHQSYSLELDDGTSVTLDWLTPASMPLFMGVEMMDLIQDEGLELKDLEQALTSIADPMLQMSMLQGISDTLGDLQYSESNNLGQTVITAALGYLTQGLTNSLVGQIERTVDGGNDMTYVDRDSALPAWLQREVGAASRKIPGWDYNQIPYIDAWGREEEKGDVLARAANNLFNPAYVSKVDVDKLESELQRLYDVTGDGAVLPDRAAKSFTVDGETRYLTAEEYVRYAKASGQNSYRYASEAVQSAAYRRLSDEQKAEVIGNLYSYAKYKAKKLIEPDYDPTTYRKAAEAEKNGTSPVQFYLQKATDK